MEDGKSRRWEIEGGGAEVGSGCGKGPGLLGIGLHHEYEEGKRRCCRMRREERELPVVQRKGAKST